MNTEIFTLAPIFTNHMVLQRDVPIRIFGKGCTGHRITASLGDHQVSTIVSDQLWCLSLPPMEAGGTHQLTVSSGQYNVNLEDILIGEVWLAGGQSNMEWQLELADQEEGFLESSAIDTIRWFDVPRITLDMPYPEGVQWQRSSPETAPHFSAVAQHFARRLHDELGVPIGIIGCTWGGSPAEAWMSIEAQSSPECHRIHLDRYLEGTENFEWQSYRETLEHKKSIDQERSTLHRSGVKLEDLPPSPPAPYGPLFPSRPAGLYESMLKTIARFTLRGALWYQGESNAEGQRAEAYRSLLPSLIKNWRELWGQGDFPFIAVQLPGFVPKNEAGHGKWLILRESIQLAAETTPQVGFTVNLDLGVIDDIHPPNKGPIGRRLAGKALEDVYGRSLGAQFSVLSGVREEKGAWILDFAHAYHGLVIKGGATLCLILENGDTLDAPIEARGSSLILKKIQGVREILYAQTDWTEPTLFHSEGLPVAPFRLTLLQRNKS